MESDENMFHLVQNSYILSMHKTQIVKFYENIHFGYITFGYEFCAGTPKSPNQNTAFIGCRVLMVGVLDMNTKSVLQSYMHIQK